MIRFKTYINEHIKGGVNSYLALQKAKEKAKKMGKVWSKMGEPEKEKLIDIEMKAFGYEKKPGNQIYTKIPSEREKAYADKVKAADKAVDKMSHDDKVDYYGKNPHLSTAGKDISDEGMTKIRIKRMEAQIDSLEKLAQKAGERAYDAEEEGNDRAFEKYQEEEEELLDRIRSIQSKIDDLKYDLNNKPERI